MNTRYWRHMFDRRSDTGTIVSVGLIAAVAGAALTYFLYATEVGTDKREKMSRVAKKLKKHAMEAKDDIKDVLTEEVTDIEDEDDEDA